MEGPQDWALGRWLYKVKEKEKRTVWHLGNKTKKKKERERERERERECVCCARVIVCAHACDVQESVRVCVRVICERERESLRKINPIQNPLSPLLLFYDRKTTVWILNPRISERPKNLLF